MKAEVRDIHDLLLPPSASVAYRDGKRRRWVEAAKKELLDANEPFAPTKPVVTGNMVTEGWTTVVAATALGWQTIGVWTVQGYSSIPLTAEQREVFERAFTAVRRMEGSRAISEGRALELICADFLAGVGL